MKVSVLINNYNHEEFIGQAIESVLKQTYDNFEIIVCDDCSTDNSVEIIKQYTEKVTLVSSTTHGEINSLNQLRAIQKAFNYCSGEIICLLDGDDLFESTKLEKIVDCFKKDQEIVMVQNVLKKVDKNLEVIGNNLATIIEIEDYKNYIKKTGSILSLFAPTSGLSFKRDFFEEVIFNIDESGTDLIWADLRLAYNAVFKGVIKTINEPLTLYRIHTTNFILTLNYERYLELMNQAKKYFIDTANKYNEKVTLLDFPEMFKHSPFIEVYSNKEKLNNLPTNQKVIIWGAGEAGQSISQYLIAKGFKIRCFIEGDKSKQGRLLYGYKILDENVLKKYKEDTLVITPFYAVGSIYEHVTKKNMDYKGRVVNPYKQGDE